METHDERQPEYMTLTQASAHTGLQKGSLYYHFRKLGITTIFFEGNNHAYLRREDAQLILDLRKQPWKVSKIR